MKKKRNPNIFNNLKNEFNVVNRLCRLCNKKMNAIPGEAGIKNPMELVVESRIDLEPSSYCEYSNLKVK